MKGIVLTVWTVVLLAGASAVVGQEHGLMQSSEVK